MKKDSINNAQPFDLRKKRNQDVIKRMRRGDTLSSFDNNSSWFPPRPTIEKDADAIAKVYGRRAGERSFPNPKYARETHNGSKSAENIETKSIREDSRRLLQPEIKDERVGRAVDASKTDDQMAIVVQFPTAVMKKPEKNDDEYPTAS